jgi:iron complex transport system substrate-binding protein
MIRFLATAFLTLLLVTPAMARAVVDSAGRKVDIPESVGRVFAAGPPASILMYILAPEKMTGWPRAPHPYERPYIAEPYRDLPETGRLTGRGNTVNLERLLEVKPDLIIDFGSVNDTYKSLADTIQAQTGIPYILIDGRFENTPTALRLVGEAIGVKDRGEELAQYVEGLFAEIDTGLAGVEDKDRPRVYLARGPNGLATGMKGSINTEIIERAGGINVADPGDAAVRRGIVNVSPEQVIVANPDTIITSDRTFYKTVWTDPLWSNIDAVQRKRIYLAPTAPFGWIDRPPSVNRIIGLRWLPALFFPDRFPQNIREETRRFYKLFYHVNLDDAALDMLIEWANGKP